MNQRVPPSGADCPTTKIFDLPPRLPLREASKGSEKIFFIVYFESSSLGGKITFPDIMEHACLAVYLAERGQGRRE